MKRRHVLAAPLVLLTLIPAVAAASTPRVIVVHSPNPLTYSEVTSWKGSANPRVRWKGSEAERVQFVGAIRMALDVDPTVLVLTSVQVTCEYEPLKGRIISLPGATEAELDRARQQLERGETVVWPHRDCSCGGRHPARRHPVLAIHSEFRWTAGGFAEADYMVLREQLWELRRDPTYKLVVAADVLNHAEAFKGRIISMPGATDQELADARDALSRGDSIVWHSELRFG